jgi:HEAT repeat protein
MKRRKMPLRCLWLGVITLTVTITPNVHSQNVDELRRELEEKGVEKFIQDINKLAFPARDNTILRLDDLKNPRLLQPIVETFLNNDDGHVRENAARVLGNMGDARAVEPLAHSLREDERAGVRKLAAEALGKIGEKSAIEPLVAALEDSSVGVRAGAAEALDELGWKPTTPRARFVFLVAKKDWKTCLELDKSATIDALTVLLGNSDESVRRDAIRVLSQIGGARAVDAIVSVLEVAGESAAGALGRMGDRRAVEPLVRRLEEPAKGFYKERVQMAIIRALAKLGDPRAVESLIAALEDRGRDVQVEAAKALGEIGDKRAVEPLVTALKHEHSLQAAGEPASFEPVVAAQMKNRYAPVRVAAARALGKIGDKRGVEALVSVLNDDEHRGARLAAAGSLGAIRDRNSVPSLILAALKDSDREVREQARAALLEMKDPRATDVYIMAMDSDDPDMRLKAARIVAASEDPKAANVRARALEVIEEETSYITAETTCNPFGQPFLVALHNRAGKIVAMRTREYDGSYMVSETLTDVSAGKKISTCAFDSRGQRVQPATFLCLDTNGDIIRDRKGNPVLAETFSAEQKAITSFRYNDFNPTIKAAATTRIYPCRNCATQTGMADCSYVW